MEILLNYINLKNNLTIKLRLQKKNGVNRHCFGNSAKK